MRLLLALFFSIGTVAGQIDQLVSKLPSCALQCALQYIPESNCSLTDLPCICDAKQLWVDMNRCAVANCTTRESLSAQATAADACGWPIRDKGLTIVILGPVLCAVALVFVIIRLIARRRATSDFFGADDTTIIIAWCAGMPLAVFDGFYYKYGLGQDIWRVPFDHITELLKYFYLGELSYLFSIVLVKISLLLFFLRIFPNHWFRQFTKVMIGVCVAFAFGFFWPLTFQCNPVNYAWLRWDGTRQGTCIDVYVGGFAHAAINMVLDIIILIMPMPLLYRLQLRYSWRQRSHVFIMFSFGLIVTVVSMLRLNTLVTFGNSTNPTWDYMGVAVWSMTEVQVSIICACLPAAKVFFAKYVSTWFATTGNQSKRSRASQSQNVAPSNASKDIYMKPSSRISVIDISSPGRNDSSTELVDLAAEDRAPEANRSQRAPSPDLIATDHTTSRNPATQYSRSVGQPDRYSRPLSEASQDERELEAYEVPR